MNAATPVADAGAQSKLGRLIQLLSCDDLDAHEIERIVSVCLLAQSAPDATLQQHYGADAVNVAQYDPDGVMAFIIFVELQDYFAYADTVDELYEQITDAFERPELPDYPYDDNSFETVADFYRWVDAQLLEHHPNYQLISFGESYTNDFQNVLVYREQAQEILGLCSELGLSATPCP